MTYGEAKDIVREHFGRLGFNTHMVLQALSGGRRLVEQHGNFWWMRAEKDFSLVVDQADYLIKVATNGGLNLPNFKDAARLFHKVTTTTQWKPVAIGLDLKFDLDLYYKTTQQGRPVEAVINDTTLWIYPPKPQFTYDMRLYYWNWTNNPTLNGSTDDLISFFPDALIYAACAWGYETVLKDFQGAAYWRTLFGGQPLGRGGQLAALKRENLKRGWQDLINLEPHAGVGGRSGNDGSGRMWGRRLSDLQIYR